jgi:hypothetical protein
MAATGIYTLPYYIVDDKQNSPTEKLKSTRLKQDSGRDTYH